MSLWGVDGEGQGKWVAEWGGSPSWRSININPLTSCEACACAGGYRDDQGPHTGGEGPHSGPSLTTEVCDPGRVGYSSETPCEVGRVRARLVMRIKKSYV